MEEVVVISEARLASDVALEHSEIQIHRTLEWINNTQRLEETRRYCLRDVYPDKGKEQTLKHTVMANGKTW